MDWYYFFKQAFWIVEFAAPLVGFIYYSKLKKAGFGTFAFFLATVLILETAGYILAYKKLVVPNQALNKFVIMPVIGLYYFWLYSRGIENIRKRKKIFATAVIVYIASIVVEKLYFSGTAVMFSFSRSIATITLLLFIIHYFINLAQSPEILRFKSEFLFWISMGCLVYYGITFPYFSLFIFLPKDYPNVFYVYSFAILPLRYFLYTCYITGILCIRKK